MGVPEKDVPVVKVVSRMLSSMRLSAVCWCVSSGDAVVLQYMYTRGGHSNIVTGMQTSQGIQGIQWNPVILKEWGYPSNKHTSIRSPLKCNRDTARYILFQLQTVIMRKQSVDIAVCIPGR